MAHPHPRAFAFVFVFWYTHEECSDIITEMVTYLELSNIESMPKSETEPPENVWFSFALVGTMGGSSLGPPGGDDYNVRVSSDDTVTMVCSGMLTLF